MRRIQPEWVAVTLTIAAMLVAGVVWGARLEERVTAQDRALALAKQHTRETIEQVREDLAYIRRRLDEALDRGGLR